MGAGAVGCYFGGMLARAGARVTLIGRAPHIEAILKDGLFIDSVRFQERVRLDASGSPEAVRGAGIVLLAVKTVDTETAARAIAPHLEEGALVISMQNGVDNVERIHTASGIAAAGAAVYVSAEMAGSGRVKHNGRGDLIVGSFPGMRIASAALQMAANVFNRAGVPCRVMDDIRGPLWMKIFMNCAYNAISALTRSRYGRMVENAEIREIMRDVVNEAVAVARAEGVSLPEDDFVTAAWQLADTMANALSSTAQDIARRKATEIDSLNGYIVRRGEALGIATPVNRALHGLVKMLESSAIRNAAA